MVDDGNFIHDQPIHEILQAVPLERFLVVAGIKDRCRTEKGIHCLIIRNINTLRRLCA